MSFFVLRLKKFVYCIFHVWSWRPFFYGVAPSIEHKSALLDLSFDAVIDIGFHKGQFSLFINHFFPNKFIFAFEPQMLAMRFYNLFFNTTSIKLFNVAIGKTEEMKQLNVLSSSDSSSLLEASSQLNDICSNLKYLYSIPVQVRPLDSFNNLFLFSSILLKIDAQGYEHEVLAGANKILNHCKYVYVECSHVHFYKNQSLFADIFSTLQINGFSKCKEFNLIKNKSGKLQADYLFER